jgi:PTS system cellobiose-specific IIA component
MAGNAKSLAMEALRLSKNNNFDDANSKIKKANSEINNACHKHMDIVVREAKGEKHPFKVLFLHAEDQLLTTQTLILIIQEFVEIYKLLKNKEKNE